MQHHFNFLHRKKVLKKLKEAELFAKEGKTVLLDRGILGNLCFASLQYEEGFISKNEYDRYVDIVNSNMELLEGKEIWLLDCKVEIALERIIKRDRNGESTYTLNYLRRLQNKHHTLINSPRILINHPNLNSTTNLNSKNISVCTRVIDVNKNCIVNSDWRLICEPNHVITSLEN